MKIKRKCSILQDAAYIINVTIPQPCLDLFTLSVDHFTDGDTNLKLQF